jgi:hypothetical protein
MVNQTFTPARSRSGTVNDILCYPTILKALLAAACQLNGKESFAAGALSFL